MLPPPNIQDPSSSEVLVVSKTLEITHFFQGNKTRCVKKVDNDVWVAKQEKRTKNTLLKSLSGYLNLKVLVLYTTIENQSFLTHTAILVSYNLPERRQTSGISAKIQLL